MKTRKIRRAVFLAVVAGVILLGIILISGILKGAGKQTKGVLINQNTGEPTVYSLEILRQDEIEIEYIKTWVDARAAEETTDGNPVYYTLYHDDFSVPMEMYLFMPNANEIMGDIDLSHIKVTESGTALVLNINTEKKMKRTREDKDLILHVYVEGAPDTATAKTDRLIINGETYNCPKSTFTKLK